MIRIGLTGGIAAGKSTISAYLSRQGISVIDYDRLSYDAAAPGSKGLRRICEEFGDEACSPDGSLNRRWLAGQVFGASENAARNRRKLNSIIHPLVFREARRLDDKARGQGAAAVVHDVPLLIESLPDMVQYRIVPDVIITVEASDETRIRRMARTRGMTQAQAQDRIRAQASRQERERYADYIISADQPIDRMRAQAQSIITALTEKPVR